RHDRPAVGSLPRGSSLLEAVRMLLAQEEAVAAAVVAAQARLPREAGEGAPRPPPAVRDHLRVSIDGRVAGAHRQGGAGRPEPVAVLSVQRAALRALPPRLDAAEAAAG